MARKHAGVRLSADVHKRIEDLAGLIGARMEGEQIPFSTVLRMAVTKGLRALEAEYEQDADNPQQAVA